MIELFTPNKRKACDKKKIKIINIAKSDRTDFPYRGARYKNLKKLTYNLTSYTNKKYPCYDPIFDEVVRRLRPEWFSSDIKVKKKIERYKEEILESAKQNVGKNKYDVLRSCCVELLLTATDPDNESYDKEFTKKLIEINSGWAGKNIKDMLMAKRLEKFFLENYEFPATIKASYKNNPDPKIKEEGILFYWWRSKSRQIRKIKKVTSKSSLDNIEKFIIEETCLPNNIFTINWKFFNGFFRRFKEVEEFYVTHKRVPYVKKRTVIKDKKDLRQKERDLHRWLESRRCSKKFNLWMRVAKPIIRNSIVPNDIFSFRRIK